MASMNDNFQYIAIVVPDLEYFNASICTGIYMELSKKRYKTCIFLTHENQEKEKEYINDLIYRQDIAGIIIFSCLNNAIFYQKIINESHIPCVFVDRLLPYLPQCNFVTVDNYGGSNKISKSLIEKGAKNIAILSMLEHNKISTIEDRINGFESSCLNNPHINYYRENINYSDITNSMRRVLEKWEQSNNFPDAIFTVNHLILNVFISLIGQNKQWGDSTQNIILSCFDNLPYFDWINRPIISVEQPVKDICYYVSEILRKKIEGSSTTSYSSIILPVKIIDRYN